MCICSVYPYVCKSVREMRTSLSDCVKDEGLRAQRLQGYKLLGIWLLNAPLWIRCNRKWMRGKMMVCALQMCTKAQWALFEVFQPRHASNES